MEHGKNFAIESEETFLVAGDSFLKTIPLLTPKAANRLLPVRMQMRNGSAWIRRLV